MKLEIDHEELSTILNNNITMCEAILEVAERCRFKAQPNNPVEFVEDIVAVLDKVQRSHKLILQCLKSNTAICHQVQERNQLWD